MSTPIQEVMAERDGPRAVYKSRNPSVSKGEVWLRGVTVPYVELYKVPVDGNGQQVHPLTANDDGTTTVHPHDGTYMYELCLDGRWIYQFRTETEAVQTAERMADAMAVAVGRACHGSLSRKTPHGPVVVDAPLGPPGGSE